MFTMSYLSKQVMVAVMTLDSILSLGVNERQTSTYFATASILLANYGYHELLIELLVEIKSFDILITHGSRRVATNCINGMRLIPLPKTKIMLPSGLRVIQLVLPQDLIVFSFNYFGYSSVPLLGDDQFKECVRCSIGAFLTLAIAKDVGL